MYGCYLVDDHPLYLKYRRSVQNVTLSNLIKELEAFKLCSGVQECGLIGKLFHHVVPLSATDSDSNTSDSEEDEERPQEQFPHMGFWRSKGCLLLQEEEICVLCNESTRSISPVHSSKCLKPAQLNAPVSKTDPQRIKLTLQQHRLKCAQLEKELHEMHAELQKSSIEIDNELSKELITIL